MPNPLPPMGGFNAGRFGAKAALIVIGVGLLVIGFGWNGAAGARGGDLRFQFPFLISGGILGLALVVVGAALMITQASRENTAILEQRLDALLDALGGAGLGSAMPSPEDLAGLVVAGTASYHRPGCRLVDGREEVRYLTPAEAREESLSACRVCAPDSAGVNVTVR